MKKKLQVHQVILVAGFFVLILFPLATKATGLEYKTPLYNTEIASKPAFGLDAYWQESYQQAYEKTNFGNYPVTGRGSGLRAKL